ncbi:tRNA dihydrouridine(20/20a) synthase DusA [Marinivivus vitaminiproducens]|uniref:tRNA dihydrouridine(20/20a) synthase DusA n=1 Tax=Marinivivus vitaminiproducens TaxID=3035935 RepID=UPI00279E2E8B|nr:tRNA dihydrouridine(20/20a) synthase DusA [Geminicoccaceae bacterium SCSIO 64248]
MLSSPLHLAPMMDWSDRHWRAFVRLITPGAVLYTEMVTTGALLHGDAERHLRFDASEHPVVLQLGGSEPGDLARAARLGEAQGYNAINLNCGCPSDRVQRGRFGACLMKEPELVAGCVRAMRDAVSVPVTVKCRLGVDDHDSYGELVRFIDTVAGSGCATFIVHARKAWLQGLSPKENREIPPLDYDRVVRLKAERSDLEVIVNGGIARADQAAGLMDRGLDGVMIGRAAYQDPWCLTAMEGALLAAPTPADDRHAVLAAYLPYIESALQDGVPLKAITRHVLGLFNGLPGARRWRQILSEQAHRPGAGPELLLQAACAVGEPSAARAA